MQFLTVQSCWIGFVLFPLYPPGDVVVKWWRLHLTRISYENHNSFPACAQITRLGFVFRIWIVIKNLFPSGKDLLESNFLWVQYPQMWWGLPHYGVIMVVFLLLQFWLKDIDFFKMFIMGVLSGWENVSSTSITVCAAFLQIYFWKYSLMWNFNSLSKSEWYWENSGYKNLDVPLSSIF